MTALVLWEHMAGRGSRPLGRIREGSPEAVITKLRSEGGLGVCLERAVG